MTREGPRDRRDERVRHGNRQAERPARRAPRDAGHARGVLSGGGARGARRAAGRVLSAARVSGPVHARVLHQGRVPGTRARRGGVRRAAARRRLERAASTSRPTTLASRVKSKAGARDVESALRILTQAGAYRVEGGRRARRRAPARHAGAHQARTRHGGLARARHSARDVARRRRRAERRRARSISTGFRPGFGGGSGAMPLLDALQSRSSVDWRRFGGGAALTGAAQAARPPSDRLGDARPPPQGRSAEARRHAAVRVHQGLPARLRAPLLRRSGRAPVVRRCDNCLGTRVDVEKGAAPSLRGSARRKPQRRAAAPRRVATPDDAPALTGADEALLARLRDLRRTIAKEEQVPAYVVFPIARSPRWPCVVRRTPTRWARFVAWDP